MRNSDIAVFETISVRKAALKNVVPTIIAMPFMAIGVVFGIGGAYDTKLRIILTSGLKQILLGGKT
jgi:hypothetical protein